MDAATRWAVQSAINHILSMGWWVLFAAVLAGIAWTAQTFAIEHRIPQIPGMCAAGASFHAPAQPGSSASRTPRDGGSDSALSRAEADIRGNDWQDAITDNLLRGMYLGDREPQPTGVDTAKEMQMY